MTEMEESKAIKSILKPIVFLFLLCGIDSTKSRKCCGFLFGLYFHILCLGIISFKAVCLIHKFSWSLLVTFAIKIVALVLWWLVYSRKGKLIMLMEKLETVNEELSYADYKKLRKISTAASVSVVIIICGHSIILALRHLIPSEIGLTCIKNLNISENQAWSAVVIIFHEFAAAFVNISITFAVALFYSIYCHIFSKCIIEKRRSKTQTLHLYQNVLLNFKGMEDEFSAIVFVVFLYFLGNFFKIIVVLVFVFESGKYATVFAYLFEFALNATLTIVVTLSAENLQQNADRLRQSLFSFPEEMHGRFCLSGRYFSILEERTQLQLTGWGTFTLKKPLLLTITTWLITYGVIVIQLT